jgi:hypothetical protein
MNMKSTKAEKTAKSKTTKPVMITTTPKPVKEAKSVLLAQPAEMDQLILENITLMTQQLKALTETVDSHLLKTASIANHVVALEAILAEVISMTGVDLVNVNSRIRARVASATGIPGSADLAIDVAAYIAAPKPRI